MNPSNKVNPVHFTLVGWILLFLMAVLATAWKPSRTAVLWLAGLIILSMIVLNSKNFARLIVTQNKGGS